MDVSREEERSAHLWFLIAGTFAVGLSVFLTCVDQGLTNSPRERELASTLRELRTAQTSLDSRVTDQRQLIATHVESE